MLGMISYAVQDFSSAVSYGALNNYYSLRLLLFLLIFFIIDGILIIAFILTQKKDGEPQNADNSDS